ncbi:hypothetical protein BGZ99_006242, partial [Dissophora globulifera]
MFINKQPASGSRKTVSKKKQHQDLERVAGTSSRPSSRPTSRVGSRVNSDNEESDREFDAAEGEDDYDELHRHMDVSWEGQLKEAIEELNEKRA